MASGSPPSRRRAAREARGSWLQRCCGMVWRRRTVVLATGASGCARGGCSYFTVALFQAGLCSVYMYTGACLTLANSQHHWPVLGLPGPAVHRHWQLAGGPQAAGGWRVVARHRWLRVGAAASPRSRRRIGSSMSSLSSETSQARVKLPRIPPKPWQAERPGGCRKRERDLDWDLVRRVQAAAGAQAGWTSFIVAVEEELVDAFLIASEEAGAFCGRSQGQKLVWKACKSPWCDKFPRGSYEMQSWRRKARICKHSYTARQRLDELLLEEGHIDHIGHFGTGPRAVGGSPGCCTCEPGPMRATSIILEALAANHSNTASLDDTDCGS